MDAEAVRGLARTARSFAARFVAPLIDGEGRDGDLSLVPEALAGARDIGITASPDPAHDGHEYGVWGTSSLNDGPAASLAMLEEIAGVCAGVACCVHTVGLGAGELTGSGLDARRVGVALEEDGWRLAASSLHQTWPGCTSIAVEADSVTVSGAKDFVWAPPGSDGFVVYGAGEDGWGRVFVPVDAPGVTIETQDPRTGLAAVGTVGLRLEKVRIPEEHRLPARAPDSMLRRHWLGLAAIAVGNARGAIDAARRYTADRYQGGGAVENHPAVRILLGDAASKIEASAAHVRAAGSREHGGDAGMWTAAAAKLRATVDCCEAVTDCLQTLGGYGYMEEFRLEKRLRDAMTLKTTSPRPDDIRQLLAVTPGGGA